MWFCSVAHSPLFSEISCSTWVQVPLQTASACRRRPLSPLKATVLQTCRAAGKLASHLLELCQQRWRNRKGHRSLHPGNSGEIVPAGQNWEQQARGQQMTIDHGWIFCECLNIAMKWSTHLVGFLYLSRVVQVHTDTKSMWTHVGEEQIRHWTKTGWQGRIFECWLFGICMLYTLMVKKAGKLILFYNWNIVNSIFMFYYIVAVSDCRLWSFESCNWNYRPPHVKTTHLCTLVSIKIIPSP